VVDLEFTGEYVVPGKTPYATYQQHIGRYIFAGGFVKDKVVLDVACGTGYGTRHLLTRGAKRVVGIDISVDAINYARKKYSNGEGLDFVHADAANLPFPVLTFDIIVSFETIEHLEDQGKFLAECKRALKSGGLFISSTPNKKISSPYSEKPINPFHIRELYPEEFRHLLRQCFANITLYGQCDTNLVKRRIIRAGLNILSAIPGGGIIKNLLRKVIFSQNSDLSVKNSEEVTNEIAEQTLEKRYKVHKFNNSAVKTPAYIIAIAEKKAGG